MRIISKFKDYYDIGMGLGQDQSLVYIRTPRTVLLKDKSISGLVKSLPKAYSNSGWGQDLVCETVIVGLCGNFYPVVRFVNESDGMANCLSMEDVDRYIQSATRDKRKLQRIMEGRWGLRTSLSDMFKAYSKLEANYEPFFSNRSPIVVLYEQDQHGQKIATWDRQLRDLSFEKLIDPYTCFQKIMMFQANLGNPEKPIPKPSDKEKLQSHGFDSWSFKKRP